MLGFFYIAVFIFRQHINEDLISNGKRLALQVARRLDSYEDLFLGLMELKVFPAKVVLLGSVNHAHK